MTSYLQPILIDLFASTTDKSKPLSGGARLDWDAANKTLTATRLNRGLETTPNEQATFEREIRACGYVCSQATTYTTEPDALNQRIGVRWVIAKAAPSKAKLRAEAQVGLFGDSGGE